MDASRLEEGGGHAAASTIDGAAATQEEPPAGGTTTGASVWEQKTVADLRAALRSRALLRSRPGERGGGGGGGSAAGGASASLWQPPPGTHLLPPPLKWSDQLDFLLAAAGPPLTKKRGRISKAAGAGGQGKSKVCFHMFSSAGVKSSVAAGARGHAGGRRARRDGARRGLRLGTLCSMCRVRRACAACGVMRCCEHLCRGAPY